MRRIVVLAGHEEGQLIVERVQANQSRGTSPAKHEIVRGRPGSEWKAFLGFSAVPSAIPSSAG